MKKKIPDFGPPILLQFCPEKSKENERKKLR